MSFAEATEALNKPKEISFLDIIDLLQKNKIEIFVKSVKAQVASGAIYINKKFVGKKVILIIGD